MASTNGSERSASFLRKHAARLVSTPLHPQWLLPSRRVDPRIRSKAQVVLDIGAADQWLRAHLADGTTYIALDYPTTAVGLYGFRPQIYADATRLPFADETIDAVACYEVLEHVRDPDQVIIEIARVLVREGVVEFTMPFLYPIHDAPYDFQRWTRHGWERSLRRGGLEIDSIEPTNHPLHASAVVMSLALAGPLQRPGGIKRIFFLAMLALLVPTINISAWFLALWWPSWDAAASSYRVRARKMS